MRGSARHGYGGLYIAIPSSVGLMQTYEAVAGLKHRAEPCLMQSQWICCNLRRVNAVGKARW